MEDKLKATDWEATNEVIEEQVARESYLQWCKDNEKRRKQQATSSCVAGSSSTITSAQCGSPRSGGASPRSGGASPRSGGSSPRSPRPRGSSSPHTSLGSPRAAIRSPKSPVLMLKGAAIVEEQLGTAASIRKLLKLF